MTEEITHQVSAGHRFGRWIRTLSTTLVIAFLGAQGIAALPGGTATNHLSNGNSSVVNPDNPFNYALYCFGNFEIGNGEGHHSLGAFAIGGDAKFQGQYSFAGSNAAPGEKGLPQLAVAGQLNFDQINTLRGNLEVSSAANIHGNSYSFSSDSYHLVEGVSANFGERKAAMVARANSGNELAQKASNAILKTQGGGGWTEVEASVPSGFNAETDVLVSTFLQVRISCTSLKVLIRSSTSAAIPLTISRS